MKNNKGYLYFNGILVQMKANKGRVMLTVMGVVLAAVLFLLGTVITRTYTEMLYQEANACSKKGVLITGNISEDVIADMEVKYHNYRKSEFLSSITSYAYEYSYDKISLGVMPMIVGTNANFTSGPVYSTQGSALMYDTSIVEGRDIKKEDLVEKKRVVVISEFAANIFFPNGDAVGNFIEVSLTGEEAQKESFEIIGIYKNSYDEQCVYQKIKNAKIKRLEGINVQLNFYIPMTVYSDYSKLINGGRQAIVIRTNEDVEEKKEIEQYYGTEDDIEVSYSEKKLYDISRLNKDMILIMRCVMIIMVIIAGFNLFNSMMFSIRERVSEIGIRKALGAENVDILIQFLTEGIILAFMGAVISAVVTTLFFVCVQIYISNFTALDINIEYSVSIILEMGCYILIMATVFSFIPAWIASKTNIIDAIRFD